MTDVLAFYPDVEALVVGVLDDILAAVDGVPVGTTVGVTVPRGWTPASPPHVQVRDDLPATDLLPVAGRSTISLIARAATTTTAKAVAARAAAVLVSRVDLISALPLTGPLTARDPETNAELATATVEVVARST